MIKLNIVPKLLVADGILLHPTMAMPERYLGSP